ncbi:MBL fold metallo-hydrolase [Hyphococcus flavus]|uniref:MBL fold metallo-hydrolase n=1 Tax=Hyphococcus flavus TaxID=1866326 RepID=A0AAE9ZCD6_9PROT|nr:MBL fold metallo-hydrolase [Hyphococcus flavus]WDI31846.1 MBL fold metallo-hydrolase [Hyphococcus flavus]
MKMRGLTVVTAAVFAFCSLCSAFAAETSEELMREVVAAYGGADALNAIQQLELDSAGYSIARYQSRTTHEPYDRLPIRSFGAIDYENDRGVWENISTWPGELNMGTRSIVNGDESATLNTILRTYNDGAMMSLDYIKRSTAFWLTPLLVREMMENADEVTLGEQKEFRNIAYDTLRYRDRYTVYVNPKTRLINVISSTEGGMWDHTIDEDQRVEVIRFYDAYVKTHGVWFPTRYNQFVDGVATQDRGIYSLKINQPIDRYLQVPDGFETADTSGYGGEGWDIAVREAGDGLYVTGNGEIHVLFVEFDDYFIALEAGNFPSHAVNTLEAMKPYMNGKPLKYIVPTHHHDDHAWAVHGYTRLGAKILTTPDKEGFLRKLLNRTYGEHGPVEDAEFEFIEGNRLHISDSTNTFDVFVWPDSPHSENMIIGYHPGSESIFTGDFYLGWGVPEGSGVRQGANYSTRELDRWIKERQRAREMDGVENYIAVHGRPYTRAEMEEMLSIERTIFSLPNNEAWPTATWPDRYGLHDDTAQNPRRSKMYMGN